MMACEVHRVSGTLASMAEARAEVAELRAITHARLIDRKWVALYIVALSKTVPCCPAAGLARYFMLAAWREYAALTDNARALADWQRRVNVIPASRWDGRTGGNA